MSWFKSLTKGKLPEVKASTLLDPYGLGYGKSIDRFVEGPAKPSTWQQEQEMQNALKSFQDAISEYVNNPLPQYQDFGDVTFQELGPSAMQGISTDPRYKDAELAALRDLEQISKDGMSLADQAELARLDSQVNRQNAGRMGAIRQNMAARGLGGSGMELVSSMQAAQDATERQALASLEKAAMAQTGRRDATSRMGSLASQLQGRDFEQEAARAQATDRIAQFNAAGANNTAQYNMNNRMQQANNNTNAQINKQQNVLGAKQQGAQMQYNAGADQANRILTDYGQKRAENNVWKDKLFDLAVEGGKAAITKGKK